MKPTIKAFVFDAYGTLFDVHSVIETCNELFPNKGQQISQVWRQKQLEYSFLRQLMGRYIPFYSITKDALVYACNSLDVILSPEAEEKLLNQYKFLDHYAEVESVLSSLQKSQTAIFSNGSFDMLNPLVENLPFSHLIHEIISIDEIKQYKPTPMSYTLVLERLNVKREEVLFMSSNTWDIIGATSFGFNTAWINRNNVPMDELGLKPTYIYHDLNGILEHI